MKSTIYFTLKKRNTWSHRLCNETTHFTFSSQKFLTLFFIYHHLLNSPSKIMQFRYWPLRLHTANFITIWKTSFKKNSLLSCSSYERSTNYSKKFMNICLYFYIYRNHRWLFSKNTLTKMRLLNLWSFKWHQEEVKKIPTKIIQWISLLYLMKQNIVHSPPFLIFPKLLVNSVSQNAFHLCPPLFSTITVKHVLNSLQPHLQN